VEASHLIDHYQHSDYPGGGEGGDDFRAWEAQKEAELQSFRASELQRFRAWEEAQAAGEGGSASSWGPMRPEDKSSGKRKGDCGQEGKGGKRRADAQDRSTGLIPKHYSNMSVAWEPNATSASSWEAMPKEGEEWDGEEEEWEEEEWDGEEDGYGGKLLEEEEEEAEERSSASYNMGENRMQAKQGEEQYFKHSEKNREGSVNKQEGNVERLWAQLDEQIGGEIISWLATHPDGLLVYSIVGITIRPILVYSTSIVANKWNKKEHFRSCGQSCPCCRAMNYEVMGSCPWCLHPNSWKAMWGAITTGSFKQGMMCVERGGWQGGADAGIL